MKSKLPQPRYRVEIFYLFGVLGEQVVDRFNISIKGDSIIRQ